MEKKSPGSGKNSASDPNIRKRRVAIAYAAVAIVLFVAFQAFWTRGTRNEVIPYSRFDRGEEVEVPVKTR